RLSTRFWVLAIAVQNNNVVVGKHSGTVSSPLLVEVSSLCRFLVGYHKRCSVDTEHELEVATTLQEQKNHYRPSDSYPANYARRVAAGHDSDYYGDETDHKYIPPSDDSDSDAFDGDTSDFAADEPVAARFRAAAAATRSPPRISECVTKTEVDIDGYLTRASFEEEDDPTRPPYQ
ncbi:hypothetical protein BJ742DRAFT_849463, partial [Cladochytrium replicatum]